MQKKKPKKSGTMEKTIHAINNHLTSAGLSVELLKKEIEGKINKDQKKYLEIMTSSLSKIKRLINSPD